MTTSTTETTTTGVVELSDAELISAVRAGDLDAYGTLFERHSQAAHRLARQLVRSTDSDDLVAESFIRVLKTLQNGKGPDESFRAYLLTAMRRMHVDNVKAVRRTRPTDDEAELDRHVDWVDPAEMRFEQTAAAQAFASLPERWQLVLWHLDVEGQKPADIAPLLAMSPNSVSALAYRAREGLRQAYVQGHLAPEQKAVCRDTTSKLGAHVRGGLSARDAGKVEEHLDTCAACMGLSLELVEVNQHLSGLLGPALLGTAAAGYLGATSGVLAGFVSAAAGVKALVVGSGKAVIAPVKEAGTAAFASGTQGAVAAAVAITVVGTGTFAVAGGFSPASTPPAAAAAPFTPVVPSPQPTTPAPVVITPTPTPAPAPSSPEPTIPEPVAPAPSAPTTTYTPAPTTPVTAPKPPPATQPTDYVVAKVTVANEAPQLQRSVAATITASNPGVATAQQVDVTFTFAHGVVFRGGVTRGWSCDSVSTGDLITVVTCRRTLPAKTGDTVSISVSGTTPHGAVTVSSNEDPQPANDRRVFLAPIWVAP